MNHNLLFEFGNGVYEGNLPELKKFLINTWQQKLLVIRCEENEDTEERDTNNYQPFLQFDGNNIQAKNYVGFIQRPDHLIEIYPKVFKHLNNVSKAIMLRHIFFWFEYCRKWLFPFTQASLDTQEIDSLPELIIYLYSTHIYKVILNQPYVMYHEIEETLLYPRGAINIKRYIKNSLITGNNHKLECDYEPFLFDNKVNRIIKYCCRLLLSQTKFSETTNVLQEILFFLDEVEDMPCYIHDIQTLNINAFYEGYNEIMANCSTILQQQLYSNTSYDLSQWSLLFPMEYIFEDFLAGFLEMNFSKKWKVKYQESSRYLSDQPIAFNMQHDIFLTSKDGNNKKIIIDTKYKLRDKNYKNDLKKGIAQNDLYQVLSYAYKRGCTDVFLIYPNINENITDPDTFEIKSDFSENTVIKVTALEIPFWSITDFPGLSDKLLTVLNKYIG
jgi:5-methylcytosine-specific restriction enzyme subunit McrC